MRISRQQLLALDNDTMTTFIQSLSQETFDLVILLLADLIVDDYLDIDDEIIPPGVIQALHARVV